MKGRYGADNVPSEEEMQAELTTNAAERRFLEASRESLGLTGRG